MKQERDLCNNWDLNILKVLISNAPGLEKTLDKHDNAIATSKSFSRVETLQVTGDETTSITTSEDNDIHFRMLQERDSYDSWDRDIVCLLIMLSLDAHELKNVLEKNCNVSTSTSFSSVDTLQTIEDETPSKLVRENIKSSDHSKRKMTGRVHKHVEYASENVNQEKQPAPVPHVPMIKNDENEETMFPEYKSGEDFRSDIDRFRAGWTRALKSVDLRDCPNPAMMDVLPMVSEESSHSDRSADLIEVAFVSRQNRSALSDRVRNRAESLGESTATRKEENADSKSAITTMHPVKSNRTFSLRDAILACCTKHSGPTQEEWIFYEDICDLKSL